MLTVQDLLTQAKARQGIPSNYRLARVIGAGDNTLSNWANGRTLPDDKMALKLAELAGLPAGKVLAAVHAQREPEGSPLRQAWASLCIMLLCDGAPKARRSRAALA